MGILLLESINSPGDLKKFTDYNLKILADEIWRYLIDTVAETGGHLAPSLGVVELTISLHKTFRSPVDKIIWDVGHQSYAHKLLTGRRDQFNTLRQHNGLSGFPRRLESIHDAFGTGHSSTSISSALGFAIARDLSNEDYSVIAVIGDGAMTGGLAFEALNNVGHLKKKIIVVLNDNDMSIAKNVGALSSYLTRIRTDPSYYRGKDELENILRRIPAIGTSVFRAVDRLKDGLKYLVVPGVLFEELGFIYIGPIDGHNISAMNRVFERAKHIKAPVLIHVITKKGRGYSPAEKNPNKFHGVGPFDKGSGMANSKKGTPKLSYTEVFGRTLVNLAKEDKKIIAITAAMPEGTGLNYFAQALPDRFFDVGIAEGHAVTMAAGIAANGLKPVVAVYSTFLQRAFDHTIHDVCLQELPVTFCLDRSGIVGEDGATHHGLFDLSYLRSIPNMVVMAPSNEDELRRMLKTAIRHKGPCAIRYPRGKGTGCELPAEFAGIDIGKAKVVREGKDVLVLAVGNMVGKALEAAALLDKKGVKLTVIDSRFVKPLDVDTIIKYIKKTSKVITVEENVLHGGFGSSILELINKCNLDHVSVKCIGIPDVFVEHGDPDLLRSKYGLTPENIADTALRLVNQGLILR
ncbi:MAG TPA: 1-deoxy-D-xylulose-5-phosphate synthase [Clostridia bacterium]|nr:1-deoxy-D-xylulose-5-phosphate synthase [Clostridia bacterium]